MDRPPFIHSDAPERYYCVLFSTSCLSGGVYQYVRGCIPNLESLLLAKLTHCASHALVSRTLKPPVQDLGLQKECLGAAGFIIINFTSFTSTNVRVLGSPQFCYVCHHSPCFCASCSLKVHPDICMTDKLSWSPFFVVQTLNGCSISGS